MERANEPLFCPNSYTRCALNRKRFVICVLHVPSSNLSGQVFFKTSSSLQPFVSMLITLKSQCNPFPAVLCNTLCSGCHLACLLHSIKSFNHILNEFKSATIQMYICSSCCCCFWNASCYFILLSKRMRLNGGRLHFLLLRPYPSGYKLNNRVWRKQANLRLYICN